MAIRNTMAALIARVRQLINDPYNSDCRTFEDQEIQDVLDACRTDVKNMPLQSRPTFNGGSIQYLDYYAPYGDWEDDVVLKQWLTTTVTPSLSEPIAGHWQFASNTMPSVYLSGKTYDLYRAAADLLERLSARWAMSYTVSVNGQWLQRSQVLPNLLNLAKQYRMKQRVGTIPMVRADLDGQSNTVGLGATTIDYMASGNG